MTPSPLNATAAAERCDEHPSCLRFYRPRGAINEAGWWHARWRKNSWRLRGPDPADSGFRTLGKPVERLVDAEPGMNPLASLVPYVGAEAVMATVDIPFASGPGTSSA